MHDARLPLLAALLFGALGWAVSPGSLAAADPSKMPPDAPVKPVTEMLWGRKVTDNYRYMEALDPATLDWMKVQGAHTRSVLDAMDQVVMATGIGELQPDGSTVRLLHLSSLQSLPSAKMSPLVTLGRQQGVGPIGDIEELQGHDSDDFGPFLDALNSARGR